MADKLRRFDFTDGIGGQAKYPWDEWFDGSIWQLSRGEDFACKVLSMRTLAGETARTRGLKLRTRIPDEDTIVIQAVKP